MTDIPTITQEEAVEVIQADREAAAALVRWQREATEAWESADGEARQFFVLGFSRAIIQGIWDEHPLVQAFARHRIAALSPNMDHAVGGARGATEEIVPPIAEAGLVTADEYPDGMAIENDAIAALTTPPVNQDAVREAGDIAAELDKLSSSHRPLLSAASRVLRTLATPPLNNTGLDAVRDELTGLPLSEALANERREHDATQRAWVQRDTALREAEAKLAALATPPLDNTGLDAATVERCVKVARAFADGQKQMANEEGSNDGLKAGEEVARFIAQRIEALASGDQS